MPLRANITVNYEHQIHFTDEVFRPDNTLLQNLLKSSDANRKSRVLIITDDNLMAARPELETTITGYFTRHSDVLALTGAPVRIAGGEACKNSPDTLQALYTVMEHYGLCRHSYVIAVGGGAVLDVAGYASATAHRGMRHVRIPTTVLSQADGGVGVKNGVNVFGKKNFVGTFAPPFAVINDFSFLPSLPARERRAGFIEAIKVALIRDAEFFDQLEANHAALNAFEPAIVRDLIQRCAAAHVRHIATGGDPFELGSARPLDFGHWAAHKLEQLSAFRVHHGEAVAIGIALDVIYSTLAGHLDAPSRDRILRLIAGLGFALFTEELKRKGPDGKPAILKGLEEFREHLGGELTITLLEGIGKGFEVHQMDEAKIEEAIRFLTILSRQNR